MRTVWGQTGGKVVLEIVSVIAGLLLGIGVGVGWQASRIKAARKDETQAKTTLAGAEAKLSALGDTLSREREEHTQAMTSQQTVFENIANRVLSGTAAQLSQSQEQVSRERDTRLALTLKPLERLLEEYRKNLGEFSNEHAGALSDVRARADQLLEAQLRSQEETGRLNQLLGRGDQRGHWGEVQLVNVLEASGLRRGVDYGVQVSGTNESGRALRPDAVVKVGVASIVIDAKFPFDAFESGLRSIDEVERKAKYLEHAAALRGHVKALGDKSYWELVDPAPEFVVCFVPSDFAITTAFDADPTLHSYAASRRVLITGPTNLLSLLWSVAMVVANNDATLNAQEILRVAEEMVDRIRLVAEPVAKMGHALDDAVDTYNKMVRSVETRLLPAARAMRNMGGVQRSKSLPGLSPINNTAVAPDGAKWGTNRPAGLFDDMIDNSLADGDVIDGDVIDGDVIDGDVASEISDSDAGEFSARPFDDE